MILISIKTQTTLPLIESDHIGLIGEAYMETISSVFKQSQCMGNKNNSLRIPPLTSDERQDQHINPYVISIPDAFQFQQSCHDQEQESNQRF